MVYQSPGFLIAAFSRGEKVWKKKERKGTNLELPGGMGERGLTSSSQEGWVKGD
jgi:hypothetical protein